MKWPGEAIWLIILPKNQTETRNFHFPFPPCFSPLSWLQVLELPWDHCVLTKKSFWIVQVDFFDLIFHIKSLSDHSGKIPVLVKNQGTSYLKIFSANCSSNGRLIEWKIALFHKIFFCQINLCSKSSNWKISRILVNKVL